MSRWFGDGLGRLTRGTIFVAAVALAAACGRPDSSLQASIPVQLAKDPLTASLKLTVDVEQGVVRLAGPTATYAQQKRATEIVERLEGVRGVRNEMTISDVLLADAIKRALAVDPALTLVPIQVDARNGVVRLVSDATDSEQRARAIALTKAIDSVKDVEDRMK